MTFNPKTLIGSSVTKLAGGSATFSGTGVVTTFTVAHGLGSTPSAWAITPTSLVAAALMYATADSTNLTLNFIAAPALGTNNVSVAWIAAV